MASLPLPGFNQRFANPAAPPPSAMVGAATEPQARLSALEWSIVALAEHDRISSIREPGRYTRAVRALFGVKQPNRLANERLEALRRLAIFAWHYGWNVPKSELSAFFDAGFSSDQFELIQLSLGKARASSRRRRG